MIISAGDDDWESQISAAFKQRIQFELGHIDKLNLASGEFFKLVSAWSVQWHYTPKMTSDTSVRFRPNEFPDEPSLWNTPVPKGHATQTAVARHAPICGRDEPLRRMPLDLSK